MSERERERESGERDSYILAEIGKTGVEKVGRQALVWNTLLGKI